MNVGMYQAAAALDATSQWQDVVAENLASSSVAGFRKQGLSTAAVQAGYGSTDATGKPQFFSIPEASVKTIFQPGETVYTGESKTVALDGPGFFQVKLANGTPAVTRDGEFRVNAKGQLTSKEGYLVQGDGGPIQVDPGNHEPVTINPKGQVLQGGVAKGKISLTDFENPDLLTPTNGVYFLTDNPALQPTPSTATLRDGFVEQSNASGLGEMANMMTAMRTFEANQHVIQIQDDRMNKTITELGNPQG
jgi:flagellar basal body rod protein FlgG